MFKVPVVSHWELMLLERKPYVPDVAGFFWNSHIGSLALSSKWDFCCLFVQDHKLLPGSTASQPPLINSPPALMVDERFNN